MDEVDRLNENALATHDAREPDDRTHEPSRCEIIGCDEDAEPGSTLCAPHGEPSWLA